MSLFCLALCALLGLVAIPPVGASDTGCGEGGCGTPLPQEPEPGPEPEPEQEPEPEPPEPVHPPVLRQDGDEQGFSRDSFAAGSAAAPSGAPENVIAGPATDVVTAAAIALARGAVVLREERLASIGVSMTVLDLARQMSADDLRQLLDEKGLTARTRWPFRRRTPKVLGVSAVDASGRAYPMANHGPETDFVAPGVELLVDEGTKRAYRSGTSYVSAVATGVIAHLFAEGRRPATDALDRLRSDAKDLGAPGFDNRFGWGLLQLTGCSK